jgi:hypothetical protein
MIVRYDLSSPRSRSAVVRLGKGRYRAAQRAFLRACRHDVAVVDGPERNLWVSHWEGWLSDEQLAEANKLLHGLVDLYRRSSNPGRKGVKPYAITFGIAPVIRRK